MDLEQHLYIVEYSNTVPKKIFHTYEEASDFVSASNEPLLIRDTTLEEVLISLLNMKWDFERTC